MSVRDPQKHRAENRAATSERAPKMKPESSTGLSPSELDQLSVNTIRCLSIDSVQAANSGHPGLPLDTAPMAYVLWTLFLKHDSSNSAWFDRGRFLLSAGHGSMPLYSLLYLTGYDLSMDEIKRFRQWGSRTPGRPERGLTPGVEVTTGPLGQGFGNGAGLSMAAAHLAVRFNRPGFDVINHRTYAIVSDGDLMEGVASEVASLTGHLRLGKLLYDNNRKTLAAGGQPAEPDPVPEAVTRIPRERRAGGRSDFGRRAGPVARLAAIRRPRC
jgi:transketolase